MEGGEVLEAKEISKTWMIPQMAALYPPQPGLSSPLDFYVQVDMGLSATPGMRKWNELDLNLFKARRTLNPLSRLQDNTTTT
jgi:hypothetical protein